MPPSLLAWVRALPLPWAAGVAALEDIQEPHLISLAAFLLECDQAEVASCWEAAELLSYEFAPLRVEWDMHNSHRAADFLAAMRTIHQAGAEKAASMAVDPEVDFWLRLAPKVSPACGLNDQQAARLAADPGDALCDGVVLCLLVAVVERLAGMPPRPAVSHRLAASSSPVLLPVGVNPLPRSRAARVNNIETCLREVRQWKRFSPQHLWSANAIADGDAQVATELVRHIWDYGQRALVRRGPAPARSAPPMRTADADAPSKSSCAPALPLEPFPLPPPSPPTSRSRSRSPSPPPPPPPPPPLLSTSWSTLSASPASSAGSPRENSPPNNVPLALAFGTKTIITAVARRPPRPASPARVTTRAKVQALPSPSKKLLPAAAVQRPPSPMYIQRPIRPSTRLPVLLLRGPAPRFRPLADVTRFLTNPEVSAANELDARRWLCRLGFNLLRIDALAPEAGTRDFAGYEGGPFLTDPVRNGCVLCELVGILDPSREPQQRRIASQQASSFPMAEERVMTSLAALRRLAAEKRFTGPTQLLKDGASILRGDRQAVWGIFYALSLVFPLGPNPMDEDLGDCLARLKRVGLAMETLDGSEADVKKVISGELLLDVVQVHTGRPVVGAVRPSRTRTTAIRNWKKALDVLDLVPLNGLSGDDVARRCHDGDWRLIVAVLRAALPATLPSLPVLQDLPNAPLCEWASSGLVSEDASLNGSSQSIPAEQVDNAALAVVPSSAATREGALARRPRLELKPRVLALPEPAPRVSRKLLLV